jgi:hypothetical protein
VRALAAALTGVAAIDGHWIHLALESTVDGAMYWQEPWSIQASLPEVSGELGRIAGIIAAASIARWWIDSTGPGQYQVRMDGWSDDVVRPSASEALPTWLDAARQEEVTAARERPSDPTARFSAYWWSRPPHALPTSCSEQNGVPTGLYLVEDGFGEVRARAHAVWAMGRVYEIDSAQAWAQLCERHPLVVTASKRHDWYRTTGLAETRWVMPDWASVAHEYDAVHLQVGAYLAASGTAIEVEPGVHSVIAGWAPGDTYWLTDVVEVDPVGRIFVKDQDDDLWHPTEETA